MKKIKKIVWCSTCGGWVELDPVSILIQEHQSLDRHVTYSCRKCGTVNESLVKNK